MKLNVKIPAVVPMYELYFNFTRGGMTRTNLVTFRGVLGTACEVAKEQPEVYPLQRLLELKETRGFSPHYYIKEVGKDTPPIPLSHAIRDLVQ